MPLGTAIVKISRMERVISPQIPKKIFTENEITYISTCSLEKYQVRFDEKYLPLTEKYGERRYNWAKTSTVLQEKFKKEYPAHLHIDLLPAYQRQGWGGKLINALFEHLKSKNVKGVMLTTGKTNETACNFYKKYGFELLGTDGDDAAFGFKLI